jgi:putative ATPase
VHLADEAFDHLVGLAGGDARQALNVLEGAVALAEAEEVRDDQGRVSPRLADIEAAAQQKVLAYDRAGDGHYDTVSAFIKSLRGNDPDGALYWLASMIAAGEDPKFIARRLIIAASEDVGNADPRALQVAVAAADALEWIGLPEAQYALAQATVHVASAPKSDSVGRAYGAAMADVMNLGSLPVPAHLRTAGHPAMKQYGDGVGYRNPHEFEGDDISQQYLPDELVERRYYLPGDQGYEATIGSRMAARDDARQAAREAGRQRRKQDRPNVPMASMSAGSKANMEAKKKLAETQKKDASDGT